MTPELKPAFIEASGNDQSILLLVGRMDAKLDLLLLRDAKQDEAISALSDRITGLEKWQSRLLGAWALAVALLTYCGNYMFNHIWK